MILTIGSVILLIVSFYFGITWCSSDKDWKVGVSYMVCIPAIIVGLVGIGISLDAFDDEPKKEDQSLQQLSQLVQQEQEDYRREHGRYTDNMLDLSIDNPELDQLSVRTDDATDLQVSSDGQAYKAIFDIDGEYTMSVDDGLVVGRYCQGGADCEAQQWQSAER